MILRFLSSSHEDYRLCNLKAGKGKRGLVRFRSCVTRAFPNPPLLYGEGDFTQATSACFLVFDPLPAVRDDA